MKIIGGFLIFLALYQFNQDIYFPSVFWFLLGILLTLSDHWGTILIYTTQYIHKDKR